VGTGGTYFIINRTGFEGGKEVAMVDGGFN
jgi:hypothetical protein